MSRRRRRALGEANRSEGGRGIAVSFVMPGMFETEGLGPEVALVDGEPSGWKLGP